MQMSDTFPTPYPELNNVLQDLVESVQEILGDDCVGAYLQGSFAVGDFDIHSDVDFIIVTQTEPSEKQVHALQVMHEHIYNLDTRWAQHLEGSYFPKDVLRRYTGGGEKLWYLDNGSRSLRECLKTSQKWGGRANLLDGHITTSLPDRPQ
jgi:predicted nucleotidyltransferase